MGLEFILLTLLLAYLLGSISPSIILSRLIKGVDIRACGSGNAGMTNAIRLLGARWGTVVALVDLAKGLTASLVIPMFFIAQINLQYVDEILLRILAGLAAVAGHIWTIFFGFKGGKGVLTLAGAVLGIAPREVGICFAVFLIIFALTRYVSLGSILGSLVFTLTVFMEKFFFHEVTSPYLLGLSVIVPAVILYTHRANIGRLLRGEESKFGLKKGQPQPASAAQ